MLPYRIIIGAVALILLHSPANRPQSLMQTQTLTTTTPLLNASNERLVRTTLEENATRGAQAPPQRPEDTEEQPDFEPTNSQRFNTTPSKSQLTFTTLDFLLHLGSLYAIASCDDNLLTCNLYIFIWCSVHVGRLGLLLVVNRMLFVCDNRSQENLFGERAPTRAYMTALRAKRTLSAIGLAWFLVGNIWILGRSGCMFESNRLATLALVYLVWQWVLLMGPCLFVLVVPLIFLCMPERVRLRMFPRSVSFTEEPLGAAQEDIDALGTYRYKALGAPSSEGEKDMKEGEDVDNKNSYAEEAPSCVICLEDFKSGDTIRELPCNHSFHSDCVDTWLRRNASCPNCRATILSSVDNGGDSDDNSSSGGEDIV